MGLHSLPTERDIPNLTAEDIKPDALPFTCKKEKQNFYNSSYKLDKNLSHSQYSILRIYNMPHAQGKKMDREQLVTNLN